MLALLRIDIRTIDWSDHVKYLRVTIGRKLTFYKHITDIAKKTTRVRGMLYPVLNKSSPISMTTKLTTLKLYVSFILTYAGSSWAPFVGSFYWKTIESVQNIKIRTITGMPSIVKNSVLLKPANFEFIKYSIRSQSKTIFYKTSFFDYEYIRLLGKTQPPTNTKHILKPYPLALLFD